MSGYGRFLTGMIAALGSVSMLMAESPQEAELAKADAQLLKTANVPVEGAGLLDYFRKRSISAADVKKIEKLIRELGDDKFAVREAACYALDAIGPAAIPALQAALRDPDYEIRHRASVVLKRLEIVPSSTLAAAATRMVGRGKPEGAVEVLIAFIPFADDEYVSSEVRATLGKIGIRDKQADPALLKAVANPSPAIRAAVGDILIRNGLSESARQLRKDPDALVRFRVALALLVTVQERSVLSEIISLLADVPLESAREIEDVLLRLADKDRPTVTLRDGTPEQRRECVAAWRAWHERHGATVELSKLEGWRSLMGLTMILEIDTRNGFFGRVVELGRDNKPRWKIEGLRSPVDVALTPDGTKVLVVENSLLQASLRNVKTGALGWSTRLTQQPIACRIQADGKLFIATRNQLQEFDQAAGGTRGLYNRAQTDLVAATRAASGDMVVITRTGDVIHLNAQGKEVKSFNIGAISAQSPGIEFLATGRVLLPMANRVVEYDLSTGKEVWRAEILSPFSASRMPNGHTLVTSQITGKITELSRDGRVVSEYKCEDGFRPVRAWRR